MTAFEPAHEYDTVNVLRKGGAAKVELNRPETMNAWNRHFGVDLLAAIEAVAADDEVRAVMITGAGRGFSSGADLKEMGSNDDRTPDGHWNVRATLTERYHPIITAIRTMPKPVVAAVNGPAVGIGLSLALAADLIVAAESAYFLLAFVNIGLVPDGGSTAFLPARIGYARAAEMAMLGERVPAEQALEWGLINRVVPDDELEGACDAVLQLLAQGPTTSYAGSKRLLNRRMYAGLAEQLEAEADQQREQGSTQDFREGVTAFVEKRPPQFTGE